MTAASFNGPALPFVFLEEGGFSNNPRDPGAATNLGVTMATLRAWRNDPTLGISAVLALTRAEAAPLYASLFWNGFRCDDLPPGVDLSVFDAAVNTGHNAAKQLQRIVGLPGTACDGWIGAQTVAAVASVDTGGLALRLKAGVSWGVGVLQAGLGLRVDGQMGPVTLAAAKAHPEAVMVASLFDQQAGYYLTCPGFSVFGAGWLTRAKRRAEAAMKLAVPAGVLRAPIS